MVSVLQFVHLFTAIVARKLFNRIVRLLMSRKKLCLIDWSIYDSLGIKQSGRVMFFGVDILIVSISCSQQLINVILTFFTVS
jgi:hypothetical protein